MLTPAETTLILIENSTAVKNRIYQKIKLLESNYVANIMCALRDQERPETKIILNVQLS